MKSSTWWMKSAIHQWTRLRKIWWILEKERWRISNYKIINISRLQSAFITLLEINQLIEYVKIAFVFVEDFACQNANVDQIALSWLLDVLANRRKIAKLCNALVISSKLNVFLVCVTIVFQVAPLIKRMAAKTTKY